VLEAKKKTKRNERKKFKKKEQKLGRKRGTHQCFYSALEKRAFQNETTLCFFAPRSFFLSFFLSLKNGISLSFAFLSFYCALFEGL